MRRGFLSLCCGLLLLAVSTRSAQANLRISFEPVGPVTITPGASVTINVLIGPSDTNVPLLSLASLGLDIDALPGAGGTLLFSTTQPNAFMSDPSYVFSGVSGNLWAGLDFWQTPLIPSEFLSGGDVAFDPNTFTEIDVPVDQTYLLAQFTVEASADAYGSFVVFLDPATTQFLLSDLSTIVEYDGSRLIIRVVPEPASCALAGLGAGLLFLARRRILRAR
jgi:hypothetical protein